MNYSVGQTSSGIDQMLIFINYLETIYLRFLPKVKVYAETMCSFDSECNRATQNIDVEVKWARAMVPSLRGLWKATFAITMSPNSCIYFLFLAWGLYLRKACNLPVLYWWLFHSGTHLSTTSPIEYFSEMYDRCNKGKYCLEHATRGSKPLSITELLCQILYSSSKYILSARNISFILTTNNQFSLNQPINLGRERIVSIAAICWGAVSDSPQQHLKVFFPAWGMCLC